MKIDIILPTYNRPHLLQRAIKSVLQQTCPDWELWIYDDGSDHNIQAIIEKYEDKRIHFFAGPKLTQEERKGRGGAVARNILLKKSKNDLIAYLDDDNYYWPEAIEGAIKHFREHPERNVIFGKLTYSSPETESIPREKRQVRFFTQPVSDPLCKLDTSQVMHRRECLKVSYWPEKTPNDVFEDGLFFRKLREKYTFYPVNVWFVNFYLHEYRRGTLQKKQMYIKKREDQK